MAKPPSARKSKGQRVVIVKLKPGAKLPENLPLKANAVSTALASTAAPKLSLRPLFTPDDDVGAGKEHLLLAAKQTNKAKKKTPLPTRLQRYAAVDAPSTSEAHQLVERLCKLGIVESAYVEPIPLLPVFQKLKFGNGPPPRIPPRSFVAEQRYLEDNDGGMGIRFAWTKAGGTPGKGVKAADVEKAWIVDHEDINSGRVTAPSVNTMSKVRGDRHHGTASIGLVLGRPNDEGIRGIAPDVDELHCCLVNNSMKVIPNAIQLAADKLGAGDVLLIELEGEAEHLGNALVPVELWDATFDVIQHATSKRDIIVVAAAGNGGIDLGDPRFKGAFTKRDSGAILVGAGTPPTGPGPDRSHVPQSNFGKRVDLQAYGGTVCTTGYGDLQSGENERQWYTRMFHGTSSAAALVWAACILLQSVVVQNGLPRLKPKEMRDLLVKTGRPQACGGQPCANPIGPRPDLQAALKDLGIS